MLKFEFVYEKHSNSTLSQFLFVIKQLIKNELYYIQFTSSFKLID